MERCGSAMAATATCWNPLLRWPARGGSVAAARSTGVGRRGSTSARGPAVTASLWWSCCCGSLSGGWRTSQGWGGGLGWRTTAIAAAGRRGAWGRAVAPCLPPAVVNANCVLPVKEPIGKLGKNRQLDKHAQGWKKMDRSLTNFSVLLLTILVLCVCYLSSFVNNLLFWSFLSEFSKNYGPVFPFWFLPNFRP
jgi:hypothetical protein